jgi:hypothetical protein
MSTIPSSQLSRYYCYSVSCPSQLFDITATGSSQEQSSLWYYRLPKEAYNKWYGDATAQGTDPSVPVESIESIKSLQDNLNTLTAVVRL